MDAAKSSRELYGQEPPFEPVAEPEPEPEETNVNQSTGIMQLLGKILE